MAGLAPRPSSVLTASFFPSVHATHKGEWPSLSLWLTRAAILWKGAGMVGRGGRRGNAVGEKGVAGRRRSSVNSVVDQPAASVGTLVKRFEHTRTPGSRSEMELGAWIWW